MVDQGVRAGGRGEEVEGLRGGEELGLGLDVGEVLS